ncbi:MAG TPA: bifunctional RNase H/acid phosphatase [Segeticoccus sp.]|uniref:bifunctional RNase H/acid phosphatase n=1 Tax=Segeticoccus sp. TaxID=2706531 RepID=UPI002D7FC790|nr:bifunctional RNase H/acid phosphatase [Segeticoccus sp.]HET8602264.1 bifunctional RNase H/acid phosphatase [Segeticoccus sp.]
MSRRRLVVEADGGSRGNPGPAGYGALVRDPDGRLLAERAESVGIASNNVAEYSGLLAGLRAVLGVEPGADVEVRMDSKLVVEQMSGRWKIKHADMRRLALEARDVLTQISAAGGSVTFTWVPRSQNVAADALANAAMDGRSISRDLRDEGTDASSVSEEFVDARTPAEEAETSRVAPADVGEPTRLVLVRHGVTDFTVASKLDGRGGTDPALNDEGRRMARAAGEAARAYVGAGPVSVVTSGLRRAVDTGAEVAHALGVAPEVDIDWDEQAFGDWDGRSVGWLQARFPADLERMRVDADYARPGGESQSELTERVVKAFDRAVARGGTVVVATHRKPIMVVLAHLLGIGQDRIWRVATAPASLTGIEVWADGGASVSFVNDTHHLRRLEGRG